MIQNQTKAFDPTKPVQTRDGRKARILCTDRKHPTYPFVGVLEGETFERVICFTKDGLYCEGQECDDDLINTPPSVVRKCYKHVYKCGAVAYNYSSFAEAKDTLRRFLCNPPVGILKVTVYDDNSFDVEKCDE